jgi:hypothetical protein
MHIANYVLNFGVSIDCCIPLLLCAHYILGLDFAIWTKCCVSSSLCAHYKIMDVIHKVHGHCLCDTKLYV